MGRRSGAQNHKSQEPRAKSGTPALLNHRRPSTFPAACLSCGQTLLILLAVFAAFLLLTGGNARAQVPVPVTAVPVVVESTTEEYFVLYVRHDLDGTEVEIPVLVKRGEAGTTTLAENVEALPKERYRVEKYLVAAPADIDGDGIDDITELADPVGMNPVNPAHSVPFHDGALAIPSRETFEALSYQGPEINNDDYLFDLEYVKFYVTEADTENPSLYFMNTETHRAHNSFAGALGIEVNRPTQLRGEIVYHPNVPAPDGSLGVYRYGFAPSYVHPFEAVALLYELLAASMPLLENNLAYFPIPYDALALYYEEHALYANSRVNVVLEEDILPDFDFIALNPGEGYGFLRIMPLDERPNPRDVVIYESLPNDLPRVAGIITTVPQTPLSHVQPACRARWRAQRLHPVGEGRFSTVALEMDPGTRIFTTLPVFPVEERMPQE